jgi:hypothetical protein
MRQTSPGVFEWTTRTGHTYTRHPEPVPIADWNTDQDTTNDWHDELILDQTAEEFAEMLETLTLA